MHDLFYSSIYLIADINILIKRSVHTCTYNLCKYTMTSKIIPTKSKSNNITIIHYHFYNKALNSSLTLKWSC